MQHYFTKHFIFLSALFGLLLQTFLPFYTVNAYAIGGPYTLSGGNQSLASSYADTSATPANAVPPLSFDGVMLICTSDGFRLVDAEEFAKLTKHSDPTSSRFACAMCYISAQSLSLITPILSSSEHHYTLSSLTYYPTFAQRLHSYTERSWHLTRAPPSVGAGMSSLFV